MRKQVQAFECKKRFEQLCKESIHTVFAAIKKTEKKRNKRMSNNSIGNLGNPMNIFSDMSEAYRVFMNRERNFRTS